MFRLYSNLHGVSVDLSLSSETDILRTFDSTVVLGCVVLLWMYLILSWNMGPFESLLLMPEVRI